MSRKIIYSMHVSLDGFVGGPNGEMDWIKVDDSMFDHVGQLTDDADAAIYGKNTFHMMDSYWPTADQGPNPTKHDKEHAQWYRSVEKYVISTTLKNTGADKVTIIGENIPERIAQLKALPGKNILIFGSPSTAYLLTQHGLIDEYRLFVNPVILGSGIPMFEHNGQTIPLKLRETLQFAAGVTSLCYEKA